MFWGDGELDELVQWRFEHDRDVLLSLGNGTNAGANSLKSTVEPAQHVHKLGWAPSL